MWGDAYCWNRHLRVSGYTIWNSLWADIRGSVSRRAPKLYDWTSCHLWDLTLAATYRLMVSIGCSRLSEGASGVRILSVNLSLARKSPNLNGTSFTCCSVPINRMRKWVHQSRWSVVSLGSQMETWMFRLEESMRKTFSSRLYASDLTFRWFLWLLWPSGGKLDPAASGMCGNVVFITYLWSPGVLNMATEDNLKRDFDGVWKCHGRRRQQLCRQLRTRSKVSPKHKLLLCSNLSVRISYEVLRFPLTEGVVRTRRRCKYCGAEIEFT